MKAELQELRAQNQKLRRENARLRKENDRNAAEHALQLEDESTIAESEALAPKKPVVGGCPTGCGVELRHIATGFGKTIKVCPECKWRMVE